MVDVMRIFFCIILAITMPTATALVGDYLYPDFQFHYMEYIAGMLYTFLSALILMD
jgi:hypothetical protein